MPPEHKKLQKLTLIENGAWQTQNEARMHHKWSQNREKYIESPKVATRWLPSPLCSEELVNFSSFGVPSGISKTTENRFFLKKSRPRERFFIDFCSDCRIS